MYSKSSDYKVVKMTYRWEDFSIFKITNLFLTIRQQRCEAIKRDAIQVLMSKVLNNAINVLEKLKVLCSLYFVVISGSIT